MMGMAPSNAASKTNPEPVSDRYALESAWAAGTGGTLDSSAPFCIALALTPDVRVACAGAAVIRKPLESYDGCAGAPAGTV
jgi:hypothetical protein